MLNEDAEALMVASRLRKSSKGAPATWSIPDTLCAGGLRIGVRNDDDLRDDTEGIREDREPESAFLAFKKTVCGTTPSFWSSTSPTTFRLFPVSGS